MNIFLMVTVLMDADHAVRLIFIDDTDPFFQILHFFVGCIFLIQSRIRLSCHDHIDILLLQDPLYFICNDQIEILFPGIIHSDLPWIISPVSGINDIRKACKRRI